MQLTHYTRDKRTVLQILERGFAYSPCPRKLFFDFTPEFKDTILEPQQFGSISFTDLEHTAARGFRNHFGKFGIGVSINWALKHDINRVLYIGQMGSLFESCRFLFRRGIQDLEENALRRGHDLTKMSYENKWMAATKGGLFYSHLLTLFEFMEPRENAWQSEWRIVNKSPDYGFRPTDDIAKNQQLNLEQVRDPKGWNTILKFVKLNPEDITAFYCPWWQYFTFRNLLPRDYRMIRIIAYFA